MNLSCEKIISENEKLKLTDLEKSCLNIYEYLKLHHHVNFLSIDIRKKKLDKNFKANYEIFLSKQDLNLNIYLYLSF